LYWRNNHTEEAQKLTWESLADKFIVGSDRDDEVRMDSEIINLSNSTVPASELAEALRDIASILTT
ncbi:MAG TPA: hypothetical protein VJT50_06785, partial [Pyrinomonadaceae bacterium]|nr:hypothetical protein [Pyrinomonadaceae bacterium]